MTNEQINAAIAAHLGITRKTGIPDFSGDLNEMHEAEQYLGTNNWHQYALHLNKVCWHWALIHAPARQRAEAFLRTLGKWEEGK
jgi:hypothetical protein